MPSITIKHIGAIVDSGCVETRPVLLLTGKQGSGKSAFMKILCFCCWVEKQVMLDSAATVKRYTHYNRFFKDLISFHRLSENFFSSQSVIDYEGECCSISFEGIGKSKNASIVKKADFNSLRHNTKPSFIPSERNLISAFKNIDRSYKAKEIDELFNFTLEWSECHEAYTAEHPLTLQVAEEAEYYYNEGGLGDTIRLKDGGKPFSTFYASSGLQSALPIEAMVPYLASLIGQTSSLSQYDMRRIVQQAIAFDGETQLPARPEELKRLKNRLTYKNASFFIEEIEQNLYPESQRRLLLKLVAVVRQHMQGTLPLCSLTLTTHSPYVISTLNVLMKASSLYGRQEEVARILPPQYVLPPHSIAAYAIEEGRFVDIVDEELDMVDGARMGSVSDWVDAKMDALDDFRYGKE